MSLEHAQQLLNKDYIDLTVSWPRNNLGTPQDIQLTQVELLYDLIEEVRWLRNDLHKQAEQDKIEKQ